MSVELFSIGGFTLYTHGVITALAAMLALGIAHYLAAGTPYREHITNMVPYLFVGAIAGARIWHVFFFQWGYYSQHPAEIIAIWNGGISVQGSLIGGFLAMIVYTRKHHLSFWGLADVLAPAIVLGQSIGRIGCFMNGDAYGSPTGLGFGMVYREGTLAYDKYGAEPLWPAELFESQWDLIIFTLLLLLKRRQLKSGMLFLIYNILYSVGRFNLEFLRGDSPRYALDWTAGQWTSFVVVVISVCLMITLHWYKRGSLIAARE
ncbi:phosphatidylglycerol:prolipoprotein diacylglycerol transferase [Paenibacillus cellulosilyticus]|uniref:Phosphatidylglycerol--prolipoprotein diacylglyceryl transferase n=1 Tax=Paenibacillus cellulosilyticus TaxID=375489 RepID=A0A2V2YZX7_9BACL|nr:prolipoprotein diacylglyceryl transferase [Paenibacillus cellulosilyticus]PWW08679.1 phosphatidylglycerol:prolipoprotein diacylglycerol transferase [Paenibacillus cellulosilyticus]QKS48245.1 prolipoprotein diacylglyceryl transferase [Paenibacillus cellulosilyticus]